MGGTMNAAKKLERKLYNMGRKIIRAAERQAEAIALGRTVIVTEVDGVKTYSFPEPPRVPPTPPRLSWLGGKMAHQHNPQAGRSGHKQEHAEAVIENASRGLASEIDKALKPEPESIPVPVQVFGNTVEPVV
jgi:hypothetical protein